MNKESETTELLKEWYYSIALKIRKVRRKSTDKERRGSKMNKESETTELS